MLSAAPSALDELDGSDLIDWSRAVFG